MSSPSIAVSLVIGLVITAIVAFFVLRHDPPPPPPPPAPPAADVEPPQWVKPLPQMNPTPVTATNAATTPTPNATRSAVPLDVFDANVMGQTLPLCGRAGPVPVLSSPNGPPSTHPLVPPLPKCPTEHEYGFNKPDEGIEMWTLSARFDDNFVEINRPDDSRVLGFIPIASVETPDMLIVDDIRIPLPFLESEIKSAAPNSDRSTFLFTIEGRPTPDPCQIEHCSSAADVSVGPDGGVIVLEEAHGGGMDDEPVFRVWLPMRAKMKAAPRIDSTLIGGINCCT